MNKIHADLRTFLWLGKQPRVALATLQRHQYGGGISLPNIEAYYWAEHLAPINEWLHAAADHPTYALERSKWSNTTILHFLYGGKGGQRLLPATRITLSAWRRATTRMGWDKRPTRQTPLWCCQWLGELNKLKGFGRWDDIGISTVGDVIARGELKTFQALKDEFGLHNTQYYKYVQLQHAWRAQHITLTDIPEYAPLEGRLLQEQMQEGAVSLTYRTLTNNMLGDLQALRDKWETGVGAMEDLDWELALMHPCEVAIKSRLRLIQFKVLHRVYFDRVPLSLCSQSCSVGYRKATRKGLASCCYDCIQCSEVEISNHTDSAECFSCPEDQMPNERHDSCIPKPIEYLSYHDPLGAILGGISVFGGLFTVCVLAIFVKNNKTPVVKANNLTLSYFLLLSLCLCFVCPFIFIGEPLPVTCRFRQATFGFLFTLCVSCILAKTITVIMAFSATKPDSRVRTWVQFKIPYWIAFISSLLQLLLCISWIVLSPPFQELNSQIYTRTIVNECNEGSAVAFWLMLGYMGFLATITLIVAYLARKLPYSFNEAKLITFSMLVFVSVWVSFIPAYLSTRGEHLVAVEIFAILASSLGICGCIFLPKCFIILIKPERNTKEHIMGKATGLRRKNMD
ncbi:vomeronasal type-2 receptor 26-like [Lissotriton helveticus]